MSLASQFQRSEPSPPPGGDGADRIAVLRALAGNDPNALFNTLLSTNPTFASLVEESKTKSIEQLFRDHGFDFNQFASM